MKIKVLSHAVSDTQKIARIIAKKSFSGMILALSGELGSGKTTFTGYLAKAIGVEEMVISPTFNILRSYFSGSLPLYHIDAYRLDVGNYELGLSEFIEGDGLCVIEWWGNIKPLIPSDSLFMEFKFINETSREVTFSTNNPAYYSLLEELENA